MKSVINVIRDCYTYIFYKLSTLKLRLSKAQVKINLILARIKNNSVNKVMLQKFK